MSGRPVYIYIPSLASRSAGVRVLLRLCKMLIDLGHEASLAVPKARRKAIAINGVNVPLRDVERALADRGRQPIAVYPEVVKGNPLNAPTVVRYVLNWPGALGGDAAFAPDEVVYCYSRTLCDAIPESRLLHLPVVDTKVFYDRRKPRRSGSCFYAAKFRRLGGEPTGLPSHCIEILPEGRGAQTPDEIAELLSGCEVFYIFEDTLLSLEAALCGCPTVFVPNAFFSEPFGNQEFGMQSACLGDNEALAKATANVELAARGLRSLEQQAGAAVTEFAQRIQSVAAAARTPRLLVPYIDGSIPLSEAGRLLLETAHFRGSLGARLERIRELSKLRVTLRRRRTRSKRIRTSIRLRYS